MDTSTNPLRREARFIAPPADGAFLSGAEHRQSAVRRASMLDEKSAFVEFYPIIVKKAQSTEIFDTIFLNQQPPKPCTRNQMLRG